MQELQHILYFIHKLQCLVASTFSRLSKSPKVDVMGVVRHMLLSTFPAGKEWDPLSEQQVFFITQGAKWG
jgi:hypothetical protein